MEEKLEKAIQEAKNQKALLKQAIQKLHTELEVKHAEVSAVDSFIDVLKSIDVSNQKWKNPKNPPEEGLKVIIAAPNYTAIGCFVDNKWIRWIDFPNGKTEQPKSVEEPNVFGWQYLPNWTREDFKF